MLQRSWARTVASHGQDDHRDWTETFLEDVDDLLEGSPRCGSAALARLAMDANFLSAMVLVDGATAEHYQDVADQANDWLELIGADEVDPFLAP